MKDLQAHCTLLALLASALGSHYAQAADPLPYSARTLQYLGYGTSISGDIRTIGMSGATIGLPLSMASSFDNPAHLAMTIGGMGLHLSGNSLSDANVQNEANAVKTTTILGGVDPYPWGFSFGYHVPWNEGQDYTVGGQDVRVEVFTREYQFSISRVLIPKRFTFGAGIRFGKGVKILEFPSNPANNIEHSSYTLGGSLGLDYVLPRRWIGLTVHSPMFYPGTPAANSTQGIINYFQPIVSPSRLGLGIGWVPNRYFQFGTSFEIFGTQTSTSLLADENKTIGDNITVQPRLGAIYNFIDYPELQGFFSLGTYLEMTRIQGTNSRGHLTGGLTVEPWIFSLGWGVDTASGFRNYIYSFGINVSKVMQKLDLVPRPWHPPSAGFFPPPGHLSDIGLPRALADNWQDRPDSPDFVDTVRALPGKLKDRFEKAGEGISNFAEDAVKTFKGTPTEEPKKVKTSPGIEILPAKTVEPKINNRKIKKKKKKKP